jgi:hypothetical protein
MSQAVFSTITIPAVATGASAAVDMSQLFAKAYSFVRDAGAAFTGALEGSVTGHDNWTTIVNLNATGIGDIAGHYNFVRANVTVGGALGATTALTVVGKD